MTMKTLFVSLLLFTLLHVSIACPDDLKSEIYVTNNISPNAPLVNLHCQYQDKELENTFGDRVIATEEDFIWRFCGHHTGNYLYFCDLNWGNKRQTIEAFRQDAKHKPHRGNYWSLRDDGIYVTHGDKENSGAYKKIYEWHTIF